MCLETLTMLSIIQKAEQALRTGNFFALTKELLLALEHLFTLTSYYSKNSPSGSLPLSIKQRLIIDLASHHSEVGNSV